jgi:hypothetical protein
MQPLKAPMPHRLKTWSGNAALAWLAVTAFALAALWPHAVGGEVALVGLRPLADMHVGAPLVLVALALAVFLSVRSWSTRDRLLVCAGASLCLFAVVTYAVGASAALPFALIGGNILREVRSVPARHSPIWAETQ